MAGDWIPIRHDLEEEPEVVRIVSAICPQSVRDMSARMRTTTLVVGALQRTWRLFDKLTEDGKLVGYTAEWLDQTIGIEGWAANLQHVGWLQLNEQSITCPRFTEWMGNSAKRRLKETKRKRNERKSMSAKCPQNVRNDADQRREEKRRKEKSKKNPPKSPQGDAVPFDDFWVHWPKKKAKDPARKAWAKMSVTEQRAALSIVPVYVASDDGRSEYCPHASSWLNQKRWEDDPASWARKQASPNGQPHRSPDDVD